MKKITLTNSLGGASMFCGGMWCALMTYIACYGLLHAINAKSPDLMLSLFSLLPLCAIAISFAVIGFMAINRGHALIKMKTKGNIISTIEAISIFLAILFYLTTSSLILPESISPFVFVVPIIFGISAYVVGCRFVLRKEGFEYSEGELIGKNIASVIAIIVWFSCLGALPGEWIEAKLDASPMLWCVFPIFIAYGVYRLCCWGFKRI